MKKTSYLFAVLLIAGALIARPAHAETSYSNIDILLKSLIAQVQELQRQLAIMQGNDVGATFASKPVIKYVQAPAGDEGVIYAGERASIYGSGLEGDLTIKLGSREPQYVKGKGVSDSYAQFVAPEWAGHAYVGFNVINSHGVSSDPGYTVEIIVPGDTNDIKETIDVASPLSGDAYKKGQAVPLAFTVKSSDGKPDVWINLYKQDGDKEFLVNELFYKYEDGFVNNGENKIAFYPAKGSTYDTDDLYGTFRIEMLVGEITCCKYTIDPNDSDSSGLFTIKK